MLGVVFVLLVCFLRRGIIGGIERSLSRLLRAAGAGSRADARRQREPVDARRRRQPSIADAAAAARDARLPGPILEATGLTKRYGGLVANSDIDFTVNHGELRGIIGPNGAGKSTFFKMLTCEVPPTSGHDRVRGPRHHRHERHRRVPARPDQELPGQPALHPADRAREPDHRRAGRAARQVPARPASAASTSVPGPGRAGRAHARSWSTSTARADTPVVGSSPMARSGGWRSAWRWRPRRACCCSTSRSPA